MANILQIALDKIGNLKTIYEVETGIACDCFCPNCKSPLEAKNKNKTSNESLEIGQRIAHFAHSDGSVCSHARESAIHLLAKKVLLETKTLLIPPLIRENIRLREERKVIFEKAEKEKEYGQPIFKPDIILTAKTKQQLFVEFYKTHSLDGEKISKIRTFNISCVEIDINDIEPVVNGKLNISQLREVFENDSSRITWVYNSQEESLFQKAKEKLIKDGQERKKLLGEVEVKRKMEEVKAKERRDRYENELLTKGYKLLKVYVYENYENETTYNENTRQWRSYKSFISKEEKIYCPMIKVHGKNKRLDLLECMGCEYHGTILREDNFGWKSVACGFHRNLKNT